MAIVQPGKGIDVCAVPLDPLSGAASVCADTRPDQLGVVVNSSLPGYYATLLR
jgi:hypothetical protein